MFVIIDFRRSLQTETSTYCYNDSITIINVTLNFKEKLNKFFKKKEKEKKRKNYVEGVFLLCIIYI